RDDAASTRRTRNNRRRWLGTPLPESSWPGRSLHSTRHARGFDLSMVPLTHEWSHRPRAITLFRDFLDARICRTSITSATVRKGLRATFGCGSSPRLSLGLLASPWPAEDGQRTSRVSSSNAAPARSTARTRRRSPFASTRYEGDR